MNENFKIFKNVKFLQAVCFFLEIQKYSKNKFLKYRFLEVGFIIKKTSIWPKNRNFAGNFFAKMKISVKSQHCGFLRIFVVF